MTSLNLNKLGESLRSSWAKREKNRKGYLAQQKEKTAAFRAELKPIWDALEDGQTINGCKGKEQWAKWFNPTCKNPLRQLQRIMQETPTETTSRRFLINLDKGKPEITFITDGMKYNVTGFNLNGFPASGVVGMNVERIKKDAAAKNPRTKKRQTVKEEKKPIKHAKYGSHDTWCGKRASQSCNVARAKNNATCEYCRAAMAANIRINHPETMLRDLKKELKEARENLKHHEGMVANCLPEYRAVNYKHSVKAIPERKKEITELEAKLAIWENIKTPEQAVELAKRFAAERAAEKVRLAALPKHIQDGNEQRTLCGLEIIYGETQMAWGQTQPTCEACTKESKRDLYARAIEKQDERVAEHQENDAPVKIKVTKAQAAQCDVGGNCLVFGAANYQEDAKKMVLALEQRITDLDAEYEQWKKDTGRDISSLLDFNNNDDEAKAAKKLVNGNRAAIKACRNAIWAIIHGDTSSDDPNRHIREWYEQHQAELEIAAEEKYQLTIKTLDQSYVHAVKCDTNPPGSQSHCGLDLTGGDYKTDVERVKITCPRCRIGFNEERLAQTPDEEEEPNLTIHTQGHRVRR